MKKLLTLALIVMVIFAFGCKKKEEQPVPQAPGTGAPEMGTPQGPISSPGMGAPGMGVPQQPMMVSPGTTMAPSEVVVPANVKGKWGAVKLIVEDKTTKTIQEFTVKLNSDFMIPNSNLKVEVGEFLPDFRMEPGKITSLSNEPNNPAVGIRVIEGNSQIFPAPGKKWGWLYAKPELRNIHPFEHPKFRIGLKEGVKRG